MIEDREQKVWQQDQMQSLSPGGHLKTSTSTRLTITGIQYSSTSGQEQQNQGYTNMEFSPRHESEQTGTRIKPRPAPAQWAQLPVPVLSSFFVGNGKETMPFWGRRGRTGSLIYGEAQVAPPWCSHANVCVYLLLKNIGVACCVAILRDIKTAECPHSLHCR